MRIYYNQLQATLKQKSHPIWLVFGDEPWQKNDSLNQIKAMASQQGFSEIIRFSVDDKFDWMQLVEEYQSMSLFSSQRIIELELVSGKVNDAGSKVISQLCEQLHQDVLLIFHGPKLDAPTQKRKWFKSLDKHGTFLPLYDIEGKHLTQWLYGQCQKLQLNLQPDTSALLVELFEGNLSALQQELEKLSILFGNTSVSLEEAEKLVINQAKFNPFQLIDAVLVGDISRCIKIIEQLKQEGTAITQLIWFLHKEVKQLHAMLEALSNNQNINDLFKQYRIWDKRKPIYQKALREITLANIMQAQARLAQVDLLSKTSSDFDPYLLLTDVCISIHQGQQMKNFSLDYEY